MKLLFFVLAIQLIALTGCSKSQPESVEWRLQTHTTTNTHEFEQLRLLAKDITAMSSGRFVLIPIPGDRKAVALGPEIYDAVSIGKVEMGNGWPNWWSAKHPAWASINAEPFGFMNLDASMIFFTADRGTEIANRISIQDNIIWRPAWWAGMEFGLLSKTPIRGLDDLKGKKVRIGPGLPSEILAEASGAYALPTIPAEIKQALETGDLDAVEWTTAAGAKELSLHEVSTHAIIPAIWQPSVVADFLINKPAYEALPADLRVILDTALTAHALRTTLTSKHRDIAAFESFISDNMIINQWSASDIRRWKASTKKIYENYRSIDEQTKKLIEEKDRFKKRYDLYYKYFSDYDNVDLE